MNWKGVIASWSILLLLSQCKEQTSLIGDEFFEEESFLVASIDTLTLEMSTVGYDSVATNNLDRMLIGQYHDDELGSIESSAYFQVAMPSQLDQSYVLEEQNTSYKSLVMVLVHDGYRQFGSDEFKTMNVEIAKLSDDIELDNGVIYNHTTFDTEEYVDGQKLGEQQFSNQLDTLDEIQIVLDDALGQALYDKSINDDDEFQSNLDFLEYLKGFVVRLSGESGEFFGLSLSSELRLYYTDLSDIAADSYLSFPIESNIYFNSIQYDREQSSINGLTYEIPISSNELGAASYIMGGNALATRVRIPHIRNLFFDEDDFIIASAQLKLPLRKDTYDEYFDPPTTLEMLYVDDDNQVLGTFQNTPTLFIDDEYGRDTYYTVDILEFLELQLQDPQSGDYGLLIRMPSTAMGASVNRAVIQDQSGGAELTINTIRTLNN